MKPLLRIVSNYARWENFPKALKHPQVLIRGLTYIRKELSDISEITKFINHLTGLPTSEIGEYLDEIMAKREFYNHLQKNLTYFHDKPFTPGAIGHINGRILYILTRGIKPDIVLETGVASGLSSAYILCALDDNKTGKLYSIDLPCEEGKVYEKEYFATGLKVIPIPKGKQSGWIIPDSLRGRWKLIIGRSSEVLMPTLRELNSIDVFLHDSEHSYENMMWEYQTAYPFIKPGGLLLSDDVPKNDAFQEFSLSTGTKGYTYGNMGALKKLGKPKREQ